MKGGDNVKRSVMRLVLSAVHNTEIARRKGLEDPDILRIIAR